MWSTPILTQTVLALLVASTAARTEAHKSDGLYVGGPHGNGFDDNGMIGDIHRRISAITFYGCSIDDTHPRAIQTQFRDNDFTGIIDQTVTANHGHIGDANDALQLKLAKDEYITDVYYTTYRAKHGTRHWTRIGSIAVSTNLKNSIADCGSAPKSDQSYHDAPKDSALLYFKGAAGDALDNLQAVWIPKDDF